MFSTAASASPTAGEGTRPVCSLNTRWLIFEGIADTIRGDTSDGASAASIPTSCRHSSPALSFCTAARLAARLGGGGALAARGSASCCSQKGARLTASLWSSWCRTAPVAVAPAVATLARAADALSSGGKPSHTCTKRHTLGGKRALKCLPQEGQQASQARRSLGKASATAAEAASTRTPVTSAPAKKASLPARRPSPSCWLSCKLAAMPLAVNANIGAALHAEGKLENSLFLSLNFVSLEQTSFHMRMNTLSRGIVSNSTLSRPSAKSSTGCSHSLVSMPFSNSIRFNSSICLSSSITCSCNFLDLLCSFANCACNSAS
mmetsp:Transcript_107713/g.229968  ORF Transcript_107713/g.229968 Transcript_107713/m.229968 type:complete len:320 (-) Transcript_107713:575-1534(-)